MMSSEEYDKAVLALRNEQVELWHKLLNFARDLQRGPDQPGPGERLEASIQLHIFPHTMYVPQSVIVRCAQNASWWHITFRDFHAPPPDDSIAQ